MSTTTSKRPARRRPSGAAAGKGRKARSAKTGATKGASPARAARTPGTRKKVPRRTTSTITTRTGKIPMPAEELAKPEPVQVNRNQLVKASDPDLPPTDQQEEDDGETDTG